MGRLETVYTIARSQGKIEPPEPEPHGLQPYYPGVLPSSSNGLLESSKRDILLLSHLPGWQKLTTPAYNRQGGALFHWLVGTLPLLLRHPPFHFNLLGYAQASKPRSSRIRA